ncbi:MAG TPA: hypothetical protein VLE99_01650 [Candidatus Saccharimonadales bacterium]|nr:hypothetical protein [Candidatus Saccharimonadales bacterium]
MVCLAAPNWAFITNNVLLYKYYFGPSGLVGEVHPATTLTSLWHSLTSHTVIRDALSYLFILLIAVAIFSALEGGGRVATELSDEAGMLRDAKMRHLRFLAPELWLRATVRMAVAVLWTIYIVIFVGRILPFCITQSRVGIATIGHAGQARHIVLSYAILLTALHLHIVFVRLILLRPRVFGGADILLEAERP